MNRNVVAVVGMAFFPLYIFPVSGKALTTISPEEASATIYNDSFRKEPVQSQGGSISVGDFNGDGNNDVAVLMSVSSVSKSVEIFFGPFPSQTNYSTTPHETLYLEGPGLSIDLPSPRMADVNKDGKEDLAVYRYDSSSKISRVIIVFGESIQKGSSVEKSLDQAGGLSILGPPGITLGQAVSVGDFDGNGSKDFAIVLSSATSYVNFVMAGVGLPSGTVDLSSYNPFVRLKVDGFLKNLVTGNFDGNCCDDLAMGVFAGLDSEEVHVFFGRSSFPAPGGADLVPDVKILGEYSDLYGTHKFIEPFAAGDMTGDHKDDLVIHAIATFQLHWILAGSDISSGRPILKQIKGVPESVPFYEIPLDMPLSIWKDILSDFDGDGAADLFSFNSWVSNMGGFLTTQILEGGIHLDEMGTVSLGWGGNFLSAGQGDFNGDGVEDLVAYEDFNSVYPPYGALRFLYGFKPLTHPKMLVRSGPGDGLRVSLSLSVDGSPTEMMFSDDVSPEIRDKWIPFKNETVVRLTPEGIDKKVTVRFRNSVGRESESVSTNVSIQLGSSEIVAETNRLRPGGCVTFECHVHSPGTLRAILYGPAGEKIMGLADRPVEPGIYQVQWNGQNYYGKRVARGVYFLWFEMDGETTRKEILVE